MIAAAKPDFYPNGGLMVRRDAPAPGRVDLGEVLGRAAVRWQDDRRIKGSYDAARDGTETVNIWANADHYDSDSANSPLVRRKLVSRSRYEVGSNGYSDGITKTYATDIVGPSPTLQMATTSENFNRMVEREWMAWAKETRFRRDLWTMAHAYDQDGEAFGVIRQNMGLRHPVKLQVKLVETEQCTDLYLPAGEPGRVDGIEFDQFGNPTYYRFLREHPGSALLSGVYDEPERIAARFVCQWFRQTRPGQHRGIPTRTSTLNIGASSRRWREAVVGAAENIADFCLFLQTNLPPNEAELLEPMSTAEIYKRLMTALPEGYNAFQPKAEQPTANHQEFNRSLIAEQSRPNSMPYSKAACDNSGNNFASGKLDHLPYYQQIDDVDRLDCEDLVLDVVFRQWFDFAVIAFGWLGGNPTAISEQARSHAWGWKRHPVADEKSAAQANDTMLKNGSTSLAEIATDEGCDYEDRVRREAEAYGITPEQQKQIDLLRNLPQHIVGPVAQILGLEITPETTATEQPPTGESDEDATDDAES